MIKQYFISLPKFNRGFHLITDLILSEIGELPEIGMLNIFIQHTSAGLTINENADPSVRVDFENSFNYLVPEKMSFYTHTFEGDDDMPAHLKSSIIGASLSIPISKNRLNMGIWQGIYLCEFRNNSKNRNLTLTIYY